LTLDEFITGLVAEELEYRPPRTAWQVIGRLLGFQPSEVYQKRALSALMA